MLIIHHNDLDGRCAAAVAFKYYSEPGVDIRFLEMDYKDTLDLNEIFLMELVVIVDFSFQPAVMNEILRKTDAVIWIDHHATAKDYDYGVELKGLREFEEKKFAGCELAWQFYFPEEPMPRAVRLIGNRDCWRWQPGLTHDTKMLNAGLSLIDQSPSDENWHELFDRKGDLVSDLIKRGEIVEEFRANYYLNYIKSYGYQVEFEGYKCMALNLFRCGSEAFAGFLKSPEPEDPTQGKLPGSYDIGLSFVYSAGKWTVSMYTLLETIDLGAIAKKYGGGGHRQAAGFVCEKLPF